MSEKEFDKTLRVTKLALLISGIKITPEHTMKLMKVLDYFTTHILYFCNFIALYSVIYGETFWIIDGARNGKPFVELSLISPCITLSLLATTKTWCLYVNRDVLIKIVRQLKNIHPMFDDNDGTVITERKIKRKSMKLLKFVQVLLMSIYIIVFTAFCFIPLVLSGYNYHSTGEFELIYPYVVKYQIDVHRPSFWLPVYCQQVWATSLVIFNIFGCDSLFYALCVYINMHFNLLGHRFQNVVSTSKPETQRNLASAILRHQELINLVDQSEILFSKSSLFNIVTSSLLICLSAFIITVSNEMNNFVPYITFLLMSLAQIFMVSYFGDLLMKSSMEINGCVYNCPWYNADENSKRTMLLVMVRSQKGCRLTAWKFAVLNLEVFTTILSRSWSYFALLKTVYK